MGVGGAWRGVANTKRPENRHADENRGVVQPWRGGVSGG